MDSTRIPQAGAESEQLGRSSAGSQVEPQTELQRPYVLAFDTANEAIAFGIGRLDTSNKGIEPVASARIAARRASNTQLLPQIDALLAQEGVEKGSIACVVCGRGPGSFTGVRIAMATAKGIAAALGVALIGVSTLDALAWAAQTAGTRGQLLVAADAMRKEVYPVRYVLNDTEVHRLEADRVVKAAELPSALKPDPKGWSSDNCTQKSFVTGDALTKYAEILNPLGKALPEEFWVPSGEGLLLAAQAAWQNGEADPFDATRHNPAFALPVYTRLSDAEENERIRLAKNDPKNLRTGVQDLSVRRDQRATMHDSAILNARPDACGITYKPLDAAHIAALSSLEARIMGSDAWNENLLADELPRSDRTWWAAYVSSNPDEKDELQLIGYGGGWVIDGEVQILKVGVDPTWQRRGIARELLARIAADARDLGASSCSLEVRASNTNAQAFYDALGFTCLGKRPRYYSDGEDALIMQGPLPMAHHDVAGMELQVFDPKAEVAHEVAQEQGQKQEVHAPLKTDHPHPFILAIESSCDETAAAIVDGKGNLVADVVASQIDFHARFGGVVPEIASRKHIEAICGVCDECFDVAAQNMGAEKLSWHDLDAISVTYAPGLLGALVVGLAFAKGAAWAADLPLIGVNHLEGHLYANRIADPQLETPLVASLVSGGNTMLVHVKNWGNYETLGATIDDAVGEAFDKVAKALGLGYPGGPAISQAAQKGDPDAIAFPRAMMHSGDLRFSLSGLKTAVVSYINKEREAKRPLNIADIAASFQQAVIDVQVAKTKKALQLTGVHTFCLGGGVAANPKLRAAYQRLCDDLGVKLVMPPLSACGDNAGMIALVALDRYAEEKFLPLDADAQAHADLDQPY